MGDSEGFCRVCRVPSKLRCARCGIAYYCSRDHQKMDFPAHKKHCPQSSSQARSSGRKSVPQQTTDRNDEDEDDCCPICFSTLSADGSWTYKECCGKRQCQNCMVRQFSKSDPMQKGKQLCAFCRAPVSRSAREFEERLLRRHEAQDKTATYMLYVSYAKGRFGLKRQLEKGVAKLHEAAERGHPDALFDLGTAYHYGNLRFCDDDVVVRFEQNILRAMSLYDRCLALGTSREHGNALVNRGVIAFTIGDLLTARGCYRQAAQEFGIEHAMKNYAAMHADGLADITDADLAEVRALYNERRKTTSRGKTRKQIRRV